MVLHIFFALVLMVRDVCDVDDIAFEGGVDGGGMSCSSSMFCIFG